jgi:mannan endo-1,4-beta-mannosidase
MKSPFRKILAMTALAFATGGAASGTNDRPSFIQVQEGRFVQAGQPYCYAGANLWFAAYLGAEADYGNPDRLRKELDRLQGLGLGNLRVLGASESSPLRDSLKHTFRDESEDYNEALLRGLDRLLDEMGQRDMKAVIYLNNFWEWSGGMATYLYWTNGGTIVDPSDPEHPWPAFAEFSSRFYASEEANTLYRNYIQALVTRTNTVNGKRYVDDDTIMSWQLANEPRPGHRHAGGFDRLPGYVAWISETAALIKRLDPNHLVSTGSEGTQGCLEDEHCFLEAHSSEYIDYLTFHLWPNNWGWFDEQAPESTFDDTLQRSRNYIDTHLRLARRLGKPIVMEEFGLNRDNGSFDPESSTRYRDRFYAMIFGLVEEDIGSGGPFRGTNFWAWGGSGRAEHSDFRWGQDDRAYMGDPPQEPQGLYSVLDSDESTLRVIKDHANALRADHCVKTD